MPFTDRVVGTINLFTCGDGVLAAVLKSGELTVTKEKSTLQPINDEWQVGRTTGMRGRISATTVMDVADVDAIERVIEDGAGAFSIKCGATSTKKYMGFCDFDSFVWNGEEAQEINYTAEAWEVAEVAG